MISGKGMFVWKIKNVDHCSIDDFPNKFHPKQAASLAYDAGLTHILVKILDGIWGYNQRPYYTETGKKTYKDDIIKPFVEAFQDAGIKVFGWQFNYFTDWSPAETEARNANTRVKDLGIEGFVIDAEGYAKNKSDKTKEYMQALDVDVPVALSTYRYPRLHPEVDYKTFLAGCDAVMPQVYWEYASNAGAQLLRSLNEWGDLTALPIIPTGAAYSRTTWCVTPAEVLEYCQTAVNQELPGVNFWVWNTARDLGLWDHIAQFAWPGDEIIPPAEVDAVEWVKDYLYPWVVDNFDYVGPKPV